MTRFKTTRADIRKDTKISDKDSGEKSKTICKNKKQKVTDIKKNVTKNHIVEVNKMICSYHKCKKEAVGRYTVDMDIKGLNFCKKHKGDISGAILWLVLGVEELSKCAMGFPPKRNKKQR